MDDLDRLRLGLPMYETAGGGTGWRVGGETLAGLASCARWCDLPLDIVLRAASTNKLGKLIERRSERHVDRRNTAHLDILYRKRELGLLLERDALLRQLARS
jgi:hypothetical protein